MTKKINQSLLTTFIRYRYLILHTLMLFILCTGAALLLIYHESSQMRMYSALIVGLAGFTLLISSYQSQVSRILKKRVGEKEEYISAILDNSVDAIIFLDNENKVQVWNKGAERIFGYTADEMTGHTFHRLVPPDQNPEEEIREINEAVELHGYIENYTAHRVTKDGRRIVVSLSRNVVKDRKGKIIGSAVLSRDVTDQMDIEQRIYNTEKLASIGMLAAGIAHEINNPISIILGFTDLLKEEKDRDSQEFKDLTTIEENANHTKEIVSQLLSFARVSEAKDVKADIKEAVTTVVNIVSHIVSKEKVDIQVEIPDFLPLIKGDPREFQQVVLNLVNNSLSALKGDGGKVSITAENDKKQVHLHVADNGTGIPKNIRRQIFDPFFTTKEVGKGTGLGLSLCYGIVRRQGGKISFETATDAESVNGETGTTFTVSMPLDSTN